MRALATLVALGALAGCATHPTVETIAVADEPCARAFAAFDAAVARAGVEDAEAARMRGYPWLRVDRMLASYRDSPLPEAAAAAWIAAMAALADKAREVEFANLPSPEKQALRGDFASLALDGATPLAALATCSARLTQQVLAAAQGVATLRAVAVVPDAYDDAARAAGLYPLAALPASAAIRRYEVETRSAFAMPIEQIPVRGTVRTYAPDRSGVLSASETAATLRGARERAGALGIPVFTADEARRLLATFAPVVIVDEHTGDDRIGQPALDIDAAPRVDTTAPVLFTRVAHTRLGDVALVQLVYTAWFPARTAASAFDVLAGPLDGIVWRVTLDPDGAPLLFDTIHPCGCYHWFFPTARLVLKTQPPSLDEEALAPQTLPRLTAEATIGLRVEAGTHYLRRVVVEPPIPADAQRYTQKPEDALRTLPLPGGDSRSLYGANGIVRASERPERYFFWPLGIPSAGAMRQWGHHATAFIGRRHFDEAFLLDRYFAFQRD